jgi:hypothetical protein
MDWPMCIVICVIYVSVSAVLITLIIRGTR